MRNAILFMAAAQLQGSLQRAAATPMIDDLSPFTPETYALVSLIASHINMCLVKKRFQSDK